VNADSFSNMLFVVNMLLVVMLVLDCLVCVYGVRLEDTTGGYSYQACIANPAYCGIMCVPPSPCPPACVTPGRSCPRTR
jgi:hypothetical protein